MYAAGRKEFSTYRQASLWVWLTHRIIPRHSEACTCFLANWTSNWALILEGTRFVAVARSACAAESPAFPLQIAFQIVLQTRALPKAASQFRGAGCQPAANATTWNGRLAT